MKETDRDKFVRLANKRVNNVIKAIELIGNLSNRSNYEYTADDVDKIFAILNKEIKTCRERFLKSVPKKDKKFFLE